MGDVLDMPRVTVSPEFQILFPREIRKKLCLRPGQKITLLERDDIITAIPDQRLEKFCGIPQGHVAHPSEGIAGALHLAPEA